MEVILFWLDRQWMPIVGGACAMPDTRSPRLAAPRRDSGTLGGVHRSLAFCRAGRRLSPSGSPSAIGVAPEPVVLDQLWSLTIWAALLIGAPYRGSCPKSFGFASPTTAAKSVTIMILHPSVRRALSSSTVLKRRRLPIGFGGGRRRSPYRRPIANRRPGGPNCIFLLAAECDGRATKSCRRSDRLRR
jgi:hypothetical protein